MYLQQDESAVWQEHVLVHVHHPPLWVEEECYFPANQSLRDSNTVTMKQQHVLIDNGKP